MNEMTELVDGLYSFREELVQKGKDLENIEMSLSVSFHRDLLNDIETKRMWDFPRNQGDKILGYRFYINESQTERYIFKEK